MDDPTSEKLEKLRQMLQREPNDAFLLYGIAMEHKKLRSFQRAIEFLDRTIAVDPGYSYAYFQRGQVQELLGQPDAAKQSYRDGVAAAQRVGDAHAKEELTAALEMIE